MTITPTAAPQVAINDIGSSEDFLAAIDATIKNFDDGDIVEGIIVKVDRDEVLLDIGYKTEGVIPSRELSIKHDVDPNEVVEIGDEVEALVLQKEDKEGRLILSKKRAQHRMGREEPRRKQETRKMRHPPTLRAEEACRMWQSVNADGRGSAVVLYERTDGTKNIYSALENADSKKERVAVAVGAEGGISPAEVKVLSDAGFIPVHLETNILRCETAAIYGIAAVQTVMS